MSRSSPSPALPRSRAAHPARPGPPGWARGPRGAGPDAAAERRFPGGSECRTGRGELRRHIGRWICGGTGGGMGVKGDAEWGGHVYIARLRPVRDGGAAASCGRVRVARRSSAPRSGPREALAGPCCGAGRPGRHMSGRAGAGPSRVRAGAGGARPGGVPTYLYVLSTGGAAAAAAALCGDTDPGAPSPSPPGGCRAGGALCGAAASPSAALIHCYFWPGGRSRAGGRLCLPLSPMARPPPAPPLP